MDFFQILERSQFRSRVPKGGNRQFLRRHPRAIVHDFDQGFPAVFQSDANFRGTGVEGILDQFLHHTCGAFNHFTGGNAFGDGWGQNLDPGFHGPGTPSRKGC